MAGAAAMNDPHRDVRPDMRASDTDRERIAGVLRRAVDEGRLDLAEYDERLRAAYEAKTYGELSPLIRDLPAPLPARPAAVPAQQVPVPAATRRRGRGGYWRTWATASVVVTSIWLFSSVGSGEVQNFWPIWVIGPWGILLALRSFRGHPASTHRHHR